MSVGVERKYGLTDVVLDEGEGPTGCRVVGVDHWARPKRSLDDVILADHGVSDRFDQPIVFHTPIVGESPGRSEASGDEVSDIGYPQPIMLLSNARWRWPSI